MSKRAIKPKPTAIQVYWQLDKMQTIFGFGADCASYTVKIDAILSAKDLETLKVFFETYHHKLTKK